MRTLNRNKQKMYYSLQDGTSPVYMTDDDGNVKYIEVDGEQIPVESGETEPHYTEPKLFRANINSTLTDTFIRAFGIDDSSDKATIVCAKGTLPLTKGARIWRNSAIKYKDTINMSNVDENSADYVVKDVNDEAMHEDTFLLLSLMLLSTLKKVANMEQKKLMKKGKLLTLL